MAIASRFDFELLCLQAYIKRPLDEQVRWREMLGNQQKAKPYDGITIP